MIQTHVKTGAPANSEWDFTNASVTSNIRGNFVNVSNYNEVVLKGATSRGYRAFKSILSSLTAFIHTNENAHVGYNGENKHQLKTFGDLWRHAMKLEKNILIF